MNYIGSKYKLLPFIHQTINEVVGEDLSDKIFCDMFAGTGIVGRSFKSKTQKIIANDCEYYSYVLNQHYIANTEPLDRVQALIDELNYLSVIDTGFIFRHYCWGGGADRLYFSDDNGKKIDTIRQAIEALLSSGQITWQVYYCLLAALLEGADKVANTASVYGAFLKQLKKTALQPIHLEPPWHDITHQNNEVYCCDANELIGGIEGDILYLDPPYNARQYGANYHLLNTIAEYQPFEPQGKTGLRAYQRSQYCSKSAVKQAFEDLIRQANFAYVFVSYNNEGLLGLDELRQMMSKYGNYDLKQQAYQRFKADKSTNRKHAASSTIEYLHILEKNNSTL